MFLIPDPLLPRPGIYKITNMVNGKPYIGISKNVANRVRKQHTQNSSSNTQGKLHKAYNKYGRSLFKVEPLFYYIEETISKDEINAYLIPLEVEFIILYDSVRNGYNTIESSKGYGGYGKEFSDALKTAWENPELRRLKSEQAISQWNDPEIRRRTEEAMSDPQYRQGLREKATARASDPNYRKQLSVKATKRWSDPQKRQLHSEILTAALANPESRQQRSEAALTRWADPEERQLASIRASQQWDDPEARQQQSERALARWADPEERLRMSEINKAAWARRKQKLAEIKGELIN
jgi:group I intron endonuclease